MKYDQRENKAPLEVLSGLVGAIAFSIKASGGNDEDVAGAFRSMADCYEKRADGHQYTSLREAGI